jgi:hypothetical protein
VTTIPGVETVHERSAWEPKGYRMGEDFTRTPPRLVIPNINRAAIHFSAAINVPDGDFGEYENQIPPWLAAITVSYLTNRSAAPGYTRKSDGKVFPGYPIGYSTAHDWLGGVWKLRGFDYLPAATNGHNGHTFACLLITDRFGHGTPEMWASVRHTLRYVRSLGAPIADRPWGHGEFFTNTGTGTPTACPGEDNLEDVHAGLGDLSYPEPEPPVQEDDDMMLRISRSADYLNYPNDPWICVGQTTCRPATGRDTQWADDNGVPVVDEPIFLEYANLVVAAGLPRPVRPGV